MRIPFILGLILLGTLGCGTATKIVSPYAQTPALPNDPDDAAVWIHPNNPDSSVVFINNKYKKGGIYAFDVSGNQIPNMQISPLYYPNNLDAIQGTRINLGNSKELDLLFTTERITQKIRVYTLPDLKEIDTAGFRVFEFDSLAPLGHRSPMGISVMHTPNKDTVKVFVSRKSGPKNGYLAEYILFQKPDGKLTWQLSATLGIFSGLKEIESVATDRSANALYYSDEQYCVRRINLLTLQNDSFGFNDFKSDIEGICIVPSKFSGFKSTLICVSDQQRRRINFYRATDRKLIGWTSIEADETDGIDFLPIKTAKSKRGSLLVMNNSHKNFHYYSLSELLKAMHTER